MQSTLAKLATRRVSLQILLTTLFTGAPLLSYAHVDGTVHSSHSLLYVSITVGLTLSAIWAFRRFNKRNPD